MTCIVLTGTIAPSQGISHLSISDPVERYTQYIGNICKWITQTHIDNIIFCENSAYPISMIESLQSLADFYGKKLEILQFVGDTKKAIKLGRGYGEQEILDYVMQHSQLLKHESGFYKLTGRYWVNNINDIVYAQADTPNVFSVMSPIDRRCSTAFFKCDKDFFLEHLSGCGPEVNDSL